MFVYVILKEISVLQFPSQFPRLGRNGDPLELELDIMRRLKSGGTDNAVDQVDLVPHHRWEACIGHHRMPIRATLRQRIVSKIVYKGVHDIVSRLMTILVKAS
jgi:hypothetical protein